MEASGMSQGQSQGENTGDGQGTGQDFSQITNSLESLTGGMEEMRQYLQSQPWQPQQEAEVQAEEPAPDLSSLLDDVYDPRELAERMTGYVDTATTRQIQQALQPVLQQNQQLSEELQNLKWQSDAASLVDEFPQLQDQKVAEQVFEKAREVALELTSGDEQAANAMLRNKGLIRMTYMLGRAVDTANAEQAGDPNAAHLEGGAGARPGAAPLDPAQALIHGLPEDGLGSRVLDF
jgi:hypothetical protein